MGYKKAFLNELIKKSVKTNKKHYREPFYK